MAKGFGTPPKNAPIGYVLLLVPDAKVYASDDPLEDNDNYWSITNRLDMAKVWRRKKEVLNNLGPYIEWLAEDYHQGSKDSIDVQIRALYRDEDGNLTTKFTQNIVVEKRMT